MTVMIDVAEVVTPDKFIQKAKAVLELDRLVVKDRRSGAVIFERDAPIKQITSTQWQYGEDVTVRKQSTCGCGGTRVTAR